MTSNRFHKTGRAGRDGLPSNCILFYEPSDFSRLSSVLQKEWQTEDKRVERTKMASQMANYATSTSKIHLFSFLRGMLITTNLLECRQQFILDYFGETGIPCENCDNCKGGDNKKDFTKDSLLLLQATRDTGGVSPLNSFSVLRTF